MILRPDKKLLFIHIPKTGGYSIRRYYSMSVLKKVYTQNGYRFFVNNQHATSKEARRFYPIEWNLYHKFCVVRNPWSRFVSFYNHFSPRKERVKDSFDFEYFLVNYFQDPRKIFHSHLFSSSVNFLKPCTTWIEGGIDTILRLENIETELHAFDDRMGFNQQKNRTCKSITKRST